MEACGILVGAGTLAMTLAWALLALAAPLFWVWMVIDSLLREEREYPGATPTSNNKLMWVLLNVFTQFAVVPYFFIVYSKIRRGSVAVVQSADQAAA